LTSIKHGRWAAVMHERSSYCELRFILLTLYKQESEIEEEECL